MRASVRAAGSDIEGSLSEMRDFFDRPPQNAGFRIRSNYIKVLKRPEEKKYDIKKTNWFINTQILSEGWARGKENAHIEKKVN